MAYYLGIDGGGSKTTCVVGDESAELARATSGPSNITRVGEARAFESLRNVVGEACAAANMDPRQLQRACIGVAGAGREDVAGTVRKLVSGIIPGEVEVVGDMQIALAAAFGAGPGVIVIAGTGSIAYGRDAQGRTARAGGWGFVISDEGSAHWIGRSAVTTMLRAIDQDNDEQITAETSPLLGKLKAEWNLQTLDQFVRSANSKPDFAALFPVIVAAADDGDALAQRVLQQAGEELAQLAGIVARRLFDTRISPKIPLAMAGGVFRYSPVVREVFCNRTRELDSRLEVSSSVIEPVAGALQMARQGRAAKPKAE